MQLQQIPVELHQTPHSISHSVQLPKRREWNSATERFGSHCPHGEEKAHAHTSSNPGKKGRLENV